MKNTIPSQPLLSGGVLHTPDLYFALVGLLRWAEYQHAENVKEGVQDASAIPPCITTARKAVRVEKETCAVERACQAYASDQAKIAALVGALIALKGACQNVLLPAINEAINGGFKMETWTPEQMQFSKAVELTEAALQQAKQGGES